MMTELQDWLTEQITECETELAAFTGGGDDHTYIAGRLVALREVLDKLEMAELP